MKSYPFGKSGLEISELGIGMAALGRPGYINLGHADDLKYEYNVNDMMKHTHDVLDKAYELGVRYFDAARSYGLAEQFLGQWFKKRDINNHICGSKWGYTYTADWNIDAEVHEVKNHSLEVLQRQWLETQEQLSESLRIYHIHSATLDSGVLDNKDVINYLWELKDRGTIIGLSLSGVAQSETLEKALSIESEKEKLFGSVQLTYNVLEQSVNDTILKAVDAGLGIIVKESLANGRLSHRNNELSFQDKKDVLLNISEKYDVSMDAIAIAYIRQQAWPSVILSGAASPDQLISNVKACDIELDQKDLHRLSSLKEDSEFYWKTRSNLSWN